MQIAIVGGGPAGLVAALAANQAGIEAVVFEQAENFKKIGGGILIHSNGLRVLDALGLLDSFESKITATQRLFLLANDGATLGEVDYSRLDVPQNRCGVVMRYALHEYLLNAARAKGLDVRFGHRLVSLTVADRRADLTFENGNRHRAEVVLACDGIHSATRESAGIMSHKRVIGEAYLRVIAERPSQNSTIREIWGSDGRRFGICPLPEERTYFFCSIPIGGWEEIMTGGLERWIDSWSAFGEEVVGLLRAVPDWSRASYDELREVRLDRWARPPVFVAGDAAHAMTPNLGQGANSAMVDAMVLVRLLGEAGLGALEQIARKYESIRRTFVTRIQSTSHRMGAMASLESPTACAFRNFAMSAAWRLGLRSRQKELLGAGYNPAEEAYLKPL
jgi:2-polyprenyl-6-methoxyphenol hydroxylase-like FAD-dependent oxidoreductase